MKLPNVEGFENMAAAAGLVVEVGVFVDAAMLGAPKAELAVAVGVLKMFSAVAGAAKTVPVLTMLAPPKIGDAAAV